MRKELPPRFPRAHLRVWLDPKPQSLISDLLPNSAVWGTWWSQKAGAWGMRKWWLGKCELQCPGRVSNFGPTDRNLFSCSDNGTVYSNSRDRLECKGMSSPKTFGSCAYRQEGYCSVHLFLKLEPKWNYTISDHLRMDWSGQISAIW